MLLISWEPDVKTELTMHKIITISAILACAAAAPALLYTEDAHIIHSVPLTSKSTFTQSSQVVDHGSTYVHTPIVPVVHATPVHVSAKSTITKSSQVVNHGGTALIHAPVHSVPVHVMSFEDYHLPKATLTNSNHVFNHGTTLVHTPVVPVVHSSPVYYSPPVVVKTGDSAVSHQSSTVHETVPVVKSLPLYTVHH